CPCGLDGAGGDLPKGAACGKALWLYPESSARFGLATVGSTASQRFLGGGTAGPVGGAGLVFGVTLNSTPPRPYSYDASGAYQKAQARIGGCFSAAVAAPSRPQTGEKPGEIHRRAVPPSGGGVVCGHLRSADRGPGAGLAGDQVRPQRADRRADRLGQDPGGVPGSD